MKKEKENNKKMEGYFSGKYISKLFNEQFSKIINHGFSP
jgi:hypothetical protein